ncbi:MULTISPECIES: hypothetical protein [unclassified Shinella]|uniref:hypothetical protein n=1 Tax=unclassified Shinella TaxID=2643062 RepID=UPI00225CA5F8|nr:hypothetical protein SHINE37_44641 [Rhizobiaceae bacterium]CAK7259121.1 protein of unknown function [Shinella sp. WSC3-e]
MSREHIAALVALRDKVSEECLNDDGRYFLETYNDLTQCHHGETGNYNNRFDGKAIAILWNLWKTGALDPVLGSATSSSGTGGGDA